MPYYGPEQKGAIVEVNNPSERITFQFNPPKIGESKSANYALLKVPGNSDPIMHFVSGEIHEVSFVLEFYGTDDVKDKVRWLQALQYPEFGATMLEHGPPLVLFNMGSLFNETFVVKSANPQWGPIWTNELLPRQAAVQMVLFEYTRKQISKSGFRERYK